MKSAVSVLIVEPSDIICRGLRAILEDAGNYNVLAPMHEATMLAERLPAISPDILILNPTLLSSTPKQQLASLSQMRPSMAILALVYQYVESNVISLFSHIVDIRQSSSELLTTLVDVVAETRNEPEKNDTIENYELSDRETDVLVLVAKGLSSKEIADRLSISIHTVNSHRKNITHKTGIKSVAGLAVYAMIHNLME